MSRISDRSKKSVQFLQIEGPVITNARAHIQPERLNGFQRLSNIFRIQSTRKKNVPAASFHDSHRELPIMTPPRPTKLLDRQFRVPAVEQDRIHVLSELARLSHRTFVDHVYHLHELYTWQRRANSVVIAAFKLINDLYRIRPCP